MADVRYQVPGVPEVGARGLTAFTPHFNRHAASGAQSYKYAVTGRPGTAAIPMTARRDTQISPDEGDRAQSGWARSSDAPDAIWPNQYYQSYAAEYPGAGMPVAYYSPTAPGRTTLLPVPATDWRGLYQHDSARLSRRAILNRARQLPWFPRIYTAPDGTYNG